MKIGPCTRRLLRLCLCVRAPQVTYTSLLTQCARLGQADRAGIVLDELNKRRPSSSNSGGCGGRNGDTNAAGLVREVGHVDSDTRSSSGRGTGIGDVAREEAAGRGPATAMAGTVSADPAGSENVTEAFFSRRAGTTPVPAGIETIAGPNPLAPPMATAEAITRGGATTGGEGGSGETATARGGGAWRTNRKLESDLLQLFGKADQVDAAFKVREGSGRGQRKVMLARSRQGEEKLPSFLVVPSYCRRTSGTIFWTHGGEGEEKVGGWCLACSSTIRGTTTFLKEVL